MKDIAVIGGTYNPPTRAHEAIFAACLERPDMDEVWVMPSGVRIDKPQMLPDAARLAMLELVKVESFDSDERLSVTDFEQRLPQPSQTYQTTRALRQAYPDNRFWYVYGADAYESMPTWEHGEELRRTIGTLLVPRSGYKLPPESDTIRHVQLPDTFRAVSSTLVRQACQDGEPVGLSSPAVLNYIDQQQLYKRV
jgi:nicotinate-nucleotide adenylyltransferase